MPLTAFSSSREMELDVEQLLARLAAETDQAPPPRRCRDSRGLEGAHLDRPGMPILLLLRR